MVHCRKNFALSLFYKSPSTYRYMRKNNLVLPEESTIHWLVFQPGFHINTKQIKLKTSKMSYVDKKCILDLVECFEDIRILRRTNKIGLHALVVICVQNVLDLKLIPTCIVCDQGTQNRCMFSILKVTEDNPHTICGQKFFFNILWFTTPHKKLKK
ncbi:Transposable element P transposase [Aphis craccivora]|uniref:Transposable element P transposase n=1 Tax=Aphis craccivora TaxID=307492 RepID=A0A6G0Y4E8_APHCR|nr:Transposable element P transposase [Aphis craccivora]